MDKCSHNHGNIEGNNQFAGAPKLSCLRMYTITKYLWLIEQALPLSTSHFP